MGNILRGNQRKKLCGVFFISVLSFVLVILLSGSRLIREIEYRTWDWRIRAAADPREADPRIKIISIFQSSLDYFAREQIYWKWPRGMYVPVLRFLKEAGAKGVAFDILFTEPSSYGVDDDQDLVREFSGLPVVSSIAPSPYLVLSEPRQQKLFSERQQKEDQLNSFSKVFLSHPALPQWKSATLPIPEILERSHSLGSVVVRPDSDGVFRHIVPGGYVGDVPVLTLPFAQYLNGLKQANAPSILESLDQHGRLTVRFHGPSRTYSTYPIESIIKSYRQLQEGKKPLVSPAEFSDSYVLIGMHAPGLLDLKPTPLSEIYPGVEFHATVLDNLLHGTSVRKTPRGTNIILCLALVLIAGGMSLIRCRIYFLFVAFAFLLAAFIGTAFLAAAHGWWIPMIEPVLGMSFVFAGSIGFQYHLEGRRSRFIKRAFAHYLHPQVIEKILADPSSLSLGGEKKVISVLFSDLAGFTEVAESIEPNKLVSLLNTYFTAMTNVIFKYGGTLDKYDGDAIVAFWNAPVEVKDHAYQAVRAALECQEKLTEMRDQFIERFGVQLEARIGVNTGSAVIGNFGSETRFNYTAVADSVNLAARLEGVNKIFGTRILISEATRDSLGEIFPCRKIADVRVAGRATPVRIFEPLTAEVNPEMQKQFEILLDLYRRGEGRQALEGFKKLADRDPVAQAYVARLERELAEGATADSHVWELGTK